MDNKTNNGTTIDYTNGSGSAISSGTLIHIGSGLVGVAVDDIANGAVGAVEIKGRFVVPKNAAVAMTAGKLLKLGTAGNTVQLATAGTTASGLITARVAVASTTASTTVDVVLGN